MGKTHSATHEPQRKWLRTKYTSERIMEERGASATTKATGPAGDNNAKDCKLGR
jgi:hypothetical protein